MTATTAVGQQVADAMVTCPRTHGSQARLEDIRAFFEDDHVHMALIVADDGRLVTTIERPDLAEAVSGSAPVASLGTLVGRTARPADLLDATTATLLRQRRRRLAVTDSSGRLIGLLCLKKTGTGYCSDDDINARRGLHPRYQHAASLLLPSAPALESGTSALNALRDALEASVRP